MDFESQVAKVVQSEEVMEWSQESGFVKRVRSFHPFQFLVALAFGGLNGVLATLDSQAKYQLEPMSRQALHQRYTEKAVAFMRHWYGVIVKRILSFSIPKVEVEVLESFRRVFLADSSSWDLPEKLQNLFAGFGGAASKANCKLLLSYEYISGLFSFIRLLPGKEADQKHGPTIVEQMEADDLIIFDAGFFSLGALRTIIDKCAFFVCRFVPSTSVWGRSDAAELVRLDLAVLLKNSISDAFEFTVTLGTQAAKQVECRMAAHRVPEEVANRRRQKLRRREVKQKGHHRTSALTLALCDWNVFLTNASADRIPSSMLRTVYRLRWQIELVFKQMKSVLKIHECTTRKEERFLCQTYGKLIGAMIVHLLHARAASLVMRQKVEISFDKMWKRMHEQSDSICRAFIKGCKAIGDEFRSLIQQALKSCRKDNSKRKPTTLHQLINWEGDPIAVELMWNEIAPATAANA